MKLTRTVLPLLALAAAGLTGCANRASESAFALKSPDIAEGRMMTLNEEFNGFDGRGNNVSPELSWSGAPAGTKSYAVTVYDPDAPTGSGWWHYVVVNIPASVTSLKKGAGTDGALLPAGAVQVRNDYGIKTFGGACPPKGDKPHRYQFVVHALKVEKLELPADASPALAGFMIHANTLGSARITSLYGR